MDNLNNQSGSDRLSLAGFPECMANAMPGRSRPLATAKTRSRTV